MAGHPLSPDQRAHIASARATIQRAVDGHDGVDLPAAGGWLDRVLEGTCPHGPARWERGPDRGRELVTCHGCGVSWYAAEVVSVRNSPPGCPII